jgi:hypothetical protein
MLLAEERQTFWHFRSAALPRVELDFTVAARPLEVDGDGVMGGSPKSCSRIPHPTKPHTSGLTVVCR